SGRRAAALQDAKRRSTPQELALGALLRADAVEADVSAGGVVVFHVTAGAGIGGHGSPIRREQAQGAFDDIALARNARPANDAILAGLRASAAGRRAQAGTRIGRIRAGQ